MFAPQIKKLLSFDRSWESENGLDAPVRAKLDELFAAPAPFCGTDRIGIVPDGISPRHGESFFPGEPIADFMNLPTEPPARAALLPHVRWQPLAPLRLRASP